jgi:molybdenum cofactor guanylyltransferase
MASAAILCGGHARRFAGRDKSSLIVGGRSILDRQVAELSRLTADLMLVGRAGAAALPQTRQVADRVPGKGPLGGLDAALAAARAEDVIVIACDMPFVSADFLRFLTTLTPGYDVVVPQTARGYHPLCAVYARRCAEPVARRLAAGQLTMIGLLEELRARVVLAEEIAAFGDPDRLLSNLNTPAEFDAVEDLQDHRR